jgi:L-alanine-DL-glutamate epimerase-like enolase superfamily enzyme
MKITNVKVDMCNWKTQPWKTGVGTRFGDTKQLGIVTVETDDGVSGNAFLGSSRMGANHYVPGLIEFIKPMLIGRNPQDIGKIWREMWKMNRSVSEYVIGAIDICLWDINGKTAGQPIHRLLGTCKDQVPAYSSTAFHESVEEYAEEALQFRAPRFMNPSKSMPRRRYSSRNWVGRRTSCTRTASHRQTFAFARRSGMPSVTI